MIKKITIISIIIISVALFYFVSTASENNISLHQSLGDNLYQDCGLEKLNDSEKQNLFNVMIHKTTKSFSRTTAMQFMKKEGWREIQVVGVVPADDLFDKYWLVISDNYELYTLDPWSKDELPQPGIYWAKNNISSWKILSPEAEELSFRAVDMN